MQSEADHRLAQLQTDVRTNRTAKSNERMFQRFATAAKHLGLAHPLLATPKDIASFLLTASTNVRTKRHGADCPHFRSVDVARGVRVDCTCPRAHAISSLRAMKAGLQAAFRDYGRTTAYSHETASGNPVNSDLVRRVLKAVANEQANAAVGVAKAKDVLTDTEFRQVVRHIVDRYCVEQDDLQRFALLQDALFISLDWHLHDRVLDLCEMQLRQIVVSGTSPNQVWTVHRSRTKTAREPGKLKGPVVLQESGAVHDPMVLLPALLAVGERLGERRTAGPLFRKVRFRRWKGKPPGVTSLAMDTAGMRQRFGAHLKACGLPDRGLHSLRRGGLKHLRRQGASVETRRRRGGWAGLAMMRHYDSEESNDGSDSEGESE